jgi:hypothetical protein
MIATPSTFLGRRAARYDPGAVAPGLQLGGTLEHVTK